MLEESWIYIFELEFDVEKDVFDIIGKNRAESIYVVNDFSPSIKSKSYTLYMY